MKKVLNMFIIIAFVFICSVVCGCSEIASFKSEWKDKYTAGEFGISNSKNPIAEIKLSNGDSIRVELYKDVAPISVNNFIKLAESGFYEQTIFHRVIKDFMIQTGGFIMDNGSIVNKESPYGNIKGEFESNGVTNDLKHTRGVISMARTDDNNGASAQFFICSADSAHLDGKYAAFGKVIDEESMQIVLKISNLETHNSQLVYGTSVQPATDVPIKVIKIKSVKIYK